MVDLDLGRRSEVDSDPPRRRPVWLWVALVLGVTLLAVLAGGVRLYLDSRPGDPPTGVVAVREYVAAVNAGDVDRLRKVLAPDVVWAAIGGGEVGAGPYRGQAYIDFQKSLPGFRIELLGEPIVRADQVTVATGISADLPGVLGEGVAVYTLVTVRGTTLISEILWVPQPRYR